MMNQIMRKHLKKNKKGFTLIEVVVVLVILAILAAIAVPALTGYIDDARERAAMSEARTVLVGLQHMASSQAEDNKDYIAPPNLGADGAGQLKKLTGLSDTEVGKISAIALTDTTVTGFEYEATNGKTIVYADKKFTWQ